MANKPANKAAVAEPVVSNEGEAVPHAPLTLEARSYDVGALREATRAKSFDAEKVAAAATTEIKGESVHIAGTGLVKSPLPKGFEPEPEETRKFASAFAQGKKVDEAEYVVREDTGGEDTTVSARLDSDDGQSKEG